MDAVTILAPHLQIEDIMNYYHFDSMKGEGGLIRSCCKIHGGNNPTSFVVNRDNGLWYCHTGDCGGGDIFTLVQIMENITFPQAVEWLANFFHVDITNMEIKERKSEYIKELKEWIRVTESRKKKEIKPYLIRGEVREVTKFRSFKEETLLHFQLGWTPEAIITNKEGKEYTAKNRLTIPIIHDNTQVGCTFRAVNNKDKPKWSHQPSNIETSKILYNYDNIIGVPEIVICEGIFDVWAYYEIDVPAIATYGAHLTDDQYRLIMRLGCDIVLSYDGDEAGQNATKKAIESFRNKAIIKQVLFNEGEDPENIERNQLKQLYESRERV